MVGRSGRFEVGHPRFGIDVLCYSVQLVGTAAKEEDGCPIDGLDVRLSEVNCRPPKEIAGEYSFRSKLGDLFAKGFGILVSAQEYQSFRFRYRSSPIGRATRLAQF